MKTLSRRFQKWLLPIVVAAATGMADGATVLLDDFAQGQFALSAPTAVAVSDTLLTPITSWRSISGSRAEGWSAVLARGSGVMTYSLSLTNNQEPPSYYLELAYSRPYYTFSVAGYEAVSIAISALNGEGEIMAYVNHQATGIPVSISGTGETVIPFSRFNTTAPLDSISSLRFRIIGLSSDFSVTLDRISLVPEPGVWGLLGGGVCMLMAVRRRSNPSSRYPG